MKRLSSGWRLCFLFTSSSWRSVYLLCTEFISNPGGKNTKVFLCGHPSDMSKIIHEDAPLILGSIQYTTHWSALAVEHGHYQRPHSTCLSWLEIRHVDEGKGSSVHGSHLSNSPISNCSTCSVSVHSDRAPENFHFYQLENMPHYLQHLSIEALFVILAKLSKSVQKSTNFRITQIPEQLPAPSI